jgi:hypothetical protein
VYQQNPNPAGSLFLSALLALIPLVIAYLQSTPVLGWMVP